MRLPLHRLVMLLVWIVAAGLVLLNFWRYPPGNGRDEIDHLMLIDFYATEGRFPVLPDDMEQASIQAHQPPLYHALLAALIKLGLPEAESERYADLNPFLIYDNYNPDVPPYNRVLHVQHWTGQSLPYARTFQIFRGISILLNLIGIAFAWKTVYEVFPENLARWIAPLTLAFLMLTPAFWRTAIIINNNQLMFMLGALATWLLARILRRGLDWRMSIALGITLGLGLLTKVFFFPAMLAAGVVLLYRPHPQPPLPIRASHRRGGIASPFLPPEVPPETQTERNSGDYVRVSLDAPALPHPTPSQSPSHTEGVERSLPLFMGGDLEGGRTTQIHQSSLVQIHMEGNPPRNALSKSATPPQISMHAIIIALLAILIAGWWYARNYRLYGDFTAARITEDLLDSRQTESVNLDFLAEESVTWIGETWLESWLVLNTAASQHAANAIGIALLLSSLSALGFWRRDALRGSYALLVNLFLSALGLAVFGAARNFHAEYSPPIMLTALPAISILYACGVVAWLPDRFLTRASVTAVLLMIAGTLIFHVTSFLPLYPPLERVDDAAEVDVQTRLSIDFENGVRLVGVTLHDKWVHPGASTRVKLCWEATTAMDTGTDYAFTLKFISPVATAAAQDGYPLSGRYPTTAWQPGMAFCEWIPLQIRDDAPTPYVYDVLVGMYVVGGVEVQHITENGALSNYLLVGKIGVMSALSVDLPQIVALVDDWGGLLAYDYTQEDDTFTLTLDWVGRGTASGRYQYFLHALNSNGDIIAQLDRAPLNGGLPTDFWRPGLRFTESLILDNVPPDVASFRFGVYDPVTGRRGMWSVNGESVGDGLEFLPE